MTDDPNSTAPGRCPFWVKLLLVVSLVANFAVVGLFAGAVIKVRKGDRGGSRQIEWILRFVPEERRADADALFEDRRDEVRKLRRESIEDMNAIIRAIRAEPFSPETLASALEARRASTMRRREVIQDGLVELMTGFNASERAHFADALEAKLETWAKRRRGGR